MLFIKILMFFFVSFAHLLRSPSNNRAGVRYLFPWITEPIIIEILLVMTILQTSLGSTEPDPNNDRSKKLNLHLSKFNKIKFTYFKLLNDYEMFDFGNCRIRGCKWYGRWWPCACRCRCRWMCIRWMRPMQFNAMMNAWLDCNLSTIILNTVIITYSSHHHGKRNTELTELNWLIGILLFTRRDLNIQRKVVAAEAALYYYFSLPLPLCFKFFFLSFRCRRGRPWKRLDGCY